jgi:hypothetical protein
MLYYHAMTKTKSHATVTEHFNIDGSDSNQFHPIYSYAPKRSDILPLAIDAGGSAEQAARLL